MIPRVILLSPAIAIKYVTTESNIVTSGSDIARAIESDWDTKQLTETLPSIETIITAEYITEFLMLKHELLSERDRKNKSLMKWNGIRTWDETNWNYYTSFAEQADISKGVQVYHPSLLPMALQYIIPPIPLAHYHNLQNYTQYRSIMPTLVLQSYKNYVNPAVYNPRFVGNINEIGIGSTLLYPTDKTINNILNSEQNFDMLVSLTPMINNNYTPKQILFLKSILTVIKSKQTLKDYMNILKDTGKQLKQFNDGISSSSTAYTLTKHAIRAIELIKKSLERIPPSSIRLNDGIIVMLAYTPRILPRETSNKIIEYQNSIQNQIEQRSII